MPREAGFATETTTMTIFLICCAEIIDDYVLLCSHPHIAPYTKVASGAEPQQSVEKRRKLSNFRIFDRFYPY